MGTRLFAFYTALTAIRTLLTLLKFVQSDTEAHLEIQRFLLDFAFVLACAGI